MKINLSLCDRCKRVIGEKQQIVPLMVKVGDMTFENDLCKKCADSTKAEMKKLFGNVKLDYSAIIKVEDEAETVVEESAAKQEVKETAGVPQNIDVNTLPNVKIDAGQKGPLTHEQKKIVETGYKAGLSLSEISAKAGRKEATCKKYIDKVFAGQNVAPVVPNNETAKEEEEVVPNNTTANDDTNNKIVKEEVIVPDNATDDDEINDEIKTDEAVSESGQNKHLDEGKIVALLKAGWNFKDIAYDCHCEIDDVKEVAEKYRKRK